MRTRSKLAINTSYGYALMRSAAHNRSHTMPILTYFLEQNTVKPEKQPLEKDFRAAQLAHQQQKWLLAEQGYLEILKQQPQHALTLEYLGLLCSQHKRLEEAERYFSQSVRLQPSKAVLQINLGEVCRLRGKKKRAHTHLTQAIALQPNLFQAHYNLALLEINLGHTERAVEHLKQTLELKPEHIASMSTLAALFLRKKSPEEALPLLEQAIALGSQNPNDFVNLGLIFKNLGQEMNAGQAWEKALHLRPNSVSILEALAALMKKTGRAAQAKVLYQRWIKQDPQNNKAWLKLAYCLSESGDLNSALAIGKQASRLFPDSFELHSFSAQIHHQLNQLQLEEAAYTEMLRIRPESKKALTGLAALFEQQGNLEKAQQQYYKLLQSNPESDLLRLHIDLLSPLILPSLQAVDDIEQQLHAVLDQWLKKGLRFHFSDISFFTSQTICYYTYFTRGSAHAFKEKICALFHPHIPRYIPLKQTGKPHIGYVVTKGHEGIFIRWSEQRLNHLPKGQFQITIFADQLGFQKKIASKITHPDIMHIHVPIDVQKSAEIIHNAACDILFFWENGTDRQNFFLPFFRLAPVQVHYGWPISSGNPEMDYFLVQQDSISAQPEVYTSGEKLLPIPGSAFYINTPPFPERPKSQSELGLPNQKRIYFCAQNLLKIHPDFDWAIQAILKDPNAAIILVKNQADYVTQALQDRLQASCKDVYERIVFLPRLKYSDYLSVIQHADLILDSFHYAGSTTTQEAIFAGKLVINLPTPYFRGIGTLICYQQLGVLDTIAKNREDYVSKVHYFGQNIEARTAVVTRVEQALKQHLLEQYSELKELSTEAYVHFIEMQTQFIRNSS